MKLITFEGEIRGVYASEEKTYCVTKLDGIFDAFRNSGSIMAQVIYAANEYVSPASCAGSLNAAIRRTKSQRMYKAIVNDNQVLLMKLF